MTNGVDGFLSEFDGSGEVGLPDVTSRHKTKGKNDVGGLDRGEDFIELSRGTVEVDVETGDWQLRNVVQVGIEPSEVCGEENLGSDLGESGVSRGELRLEVGSTIENKDRLVDLNPLSTSSLQIGEERLVNGDELGKNADGLEAGLSTLASFSKNEERNGTKNNGAGGDTRSLGFLELFNGLVEVELELCLVGELRDDKMVVGVKPRNNW